MSEEEKKAIKDFKAQIDSGDDYIHIWWKNAKTILNLIEKQNKELEPIRELGIPVKTVVAELNRLEDLEDDREQLKQENKELKFDIILKNEETDYLHKNYIPKSVIRDKIDEIQKLYEEALKKSDLKEIETMNHNNFKGIQLEGQRMILKELLGGSNE